MSDERAIKETIQTYFDSMFESSGDKVHAAFHPNAKITGEIDGELHEMSVADFAEFVASQQPSPKEKEENPRLEVVSLEIAGKTAVAWVRDDYLGMTFLDALSLLKTGDQWRIYTKLFHVESSPTS